MNDGRRKGGSTISFYRHVKNFNIAKIVLRFISRCPRVGLIVNTLPGRKKNRQSARTYLIGKCTITG